MGLLSIFQRKNGQGGAVSKPQDAASVEVERRRARRRLLGSVVLVLAGVAGFPLLFDTAPRLMPVDIPIEIPRKDSLPPLANKADARPPRAEVAPIEPQASVTAPATVNAPRPASAPEAKPADKAPEKAPEKAPARADEKAAEREPEPKAEAPVAAKKAAADAARAQAALDGRTNTATKVEPAAAKPGDAAARFVVQVGAFSEADSARDVRTRVEKLGLKTYTQVVETAAGKRIRVRLGPYNERSEAEKVAAQIKQAGLTSAVLTL